ncbi:MAG TPA: type II toxin-antitoxin system VapC family toxin [Candidatus Hydrogenedentes bacterium]|nr:type II toxin-antitoxin system VapC family toxin [Candidatus Hydrogenedentota bacterium]HPG66301.1 type II toxin-antitoxin system VapC family toxin [Candidatus Hydrogenedentota bacterium]
MKLLLDTHAFIWWDSEPEKLSPRALSLCEDSANQLHLSTASLWEIQIKSRLGRLKLSLPLPEIVTTQQEANGLVLLSIHPDHVYALNALPALHKDPFDRMLVAQARSEGLHLITHDETVRTYPVDVEW